MPSPRHLRTRRILFQARLADLFPRVVAPPEIVRVISSAEMCGPGSCAPSAAGRAHRVSVSVSVPDSTDATSSYRRNALQVQRHRWRVVKSHREALAPLNPRHQAADLLCNLWPE